MKRLLSVIICFAFFTSCMKQPVNVPYILVSKVVENDPNFKLSSFSAQRSGSYLQLTFSTERERNLVEMQVLRGTNPNQFCEVKTFSAKGNSDSLQTYTFTDQVAKGDTVYYIVKYTTYSGEWGCSTSYKIVD